MSTSKTPITVFGEWAQIGKDEGMERHHREAVENMLAFALPSDQDFSFIDAGCGNGWVVRRVAQLAHCQLAVGVDGAVEMIDKAQRLDVANRYVLTDLLDWSPEQTVNLVHSMEVLYYFTKPLAVLQHIYKNWLSTEGRLIIGLDFYHENTVSHDWPEDCGISIMTLLSEKQWLDLFQQAGFQNCKTWRVGAKENWAGTLVLTGIK